MTFSTAARPYLVPQMFAVAVCVYHIARGGLDPARFKVGFDGGEGVLNGGDIEPRAIGPR
jgi:hypothetical protein